MGMVLGPSLEITIGSSWFEISHRSAVMADFKPAGADGDFQAWAKHHAHDKQLHDLQIAEGKQGDGDAEVSSAHLQEGWAKEHDHEKRLHNNAIEMERHQ